MTDGQTERMNQVIEDVLRAHVSTKQQRWDEHSYLVEFAINNSRNASTSLTPFYMQNAIHSRTMLTAAIPDLPVPPAQDYLQERARILKEAREHALEAQNRQRQYVDQHRRPLMLQSCDLVLLSTKNLHMLSGVRKLSDRWVGPFSVICARGPVAYELDLPAAWQIHPVFHVSMLKQYHGTAPSRPPPVLDHDLPEYEVEALLRHRLVRGHLQLLVLWKGYPLSEATWEPFRNLTNAQRLLR